MLALTGTVLVAEVIGVAITGSLALLAGAGHMLTDVAGITLAVLAAVLNAMLLLAVAAYILIQAWHRWSDPPQVEGGLMLVFAGVGLIANTVGLLLLRSGSKESLNVKGAYLEVLGDTLGSLAVIAAAVVIATTGWLRADIVASVLVALMILPRTWTLLREAVDVLLEATPKGMDLSAIRQHIRETPGVIDAHDLHVWTLTSRLPVLSVHVVVNDAVIRDGQSGVVLDALGECLADHFDVEHCTIQLEPLGHAQHEHPGHA